MKNPSKLLRRFTVPGFVQAIFVLTFFSESVSAQTTYTYAPTTNPGITDISGTGTFIPGLSADDGGAAITLGGSGFQFFGVNYTALGVTTNGYISTDTSGSDTSFSNTTTLPDGTNGRILVLWDDLRTDVNLGSGVYHQFFASSPYANPGGGTNNGANIIQWNNASYYSGGGNFNVQAVLFENGNMLFLYGALGQQNGSSSTTGLQNPGGTESYLYAADTAGSIPDNFALSVLYAFAVNVLPTVATTNSSSEAAPVFIVTDLGAIGSTLFSSVPTALALRESSFHSSRVGINNFNQRLYHLRNRTTGSPAGVASNGSPIVEGQGDGPEVHKSSKSAKDVLPPSVNVAESTLWEVYTSFNYSNLDMDEDLNFEGLRSNTYSTGIGAEYALTPYLTLGLGTSYLVSDVKGGGNSGNTDVEGFTFVGYASAFWNNFYADLLYGATFLQNDINRDTGLGKTAHAEPNTVVQSVNFNTGYNFTFGQLVTGPYAGIDYAYSDIDGYTEHGGGTANTKVSGQTNNSLLTRLGWQASYNIVKPWGKITPQINAGWERENLNSGDDLTVGLVQSPFYRVQGNSIRSVGSFSSTVPSFGREQDYLTAGAALMVEVGTRFNVILDYQGNFFAQGFTAHYAGIKVGYKF